MCAKVLIPDLKKLIALVGTNDCGNQRVEVNCVAEIKNPEESRESKGCRSAGSMRQLSVGSWSELQRVWRGKEFGLGEICENSIELIKREKRNLCKLSFSWVLEIA